MSFFDQPYYAVTKAHMSRMGIWPEQSKYVRIIRLLMVLAIIVTLVGPMFIRFRDAWDDKHSLMHDIPHLLVGTGIFVTVLRYVQILDKVKLTFKIIEGHWEMFKNTSAVIVLDKYAERGRYMTVVYSIYVCSGLTFYGFICLTPVMLDFVDPLNQTRPKMYIFDAKYVINPDKYYWFIIAHQYVVIMVGTAPMTAIETMYFLWSFHACALFEVVAFNLKLVTSNKDPVCKENAITPRNDWNYKNICDCIIVHEEAISFADWIESISSGIFTVVIAIAAIIIVFTGVQAVLNFKHLDMLMQFGLYTLAQIVHLYINIMPGQELINHSRKIHTTAYDLEWHDMSVKAQKLLIPILIRSNKPCQLTAKKVYVMSMESFGSTIRTIISYFTILLQLI